jgi:hypothetical protein
VIGRLVSALARAREGSGATSRAPRHLEIWGELETQNRFLRRLAVAACVWAFVALGGAAAALHVGLFQPLAFHVGADGEASFLGRLRESSAPADAEVRYVAKRFLERYASLNSLTIERDLADAWNLMSDELRAEHARMLATYQQERGEELVAAVKAQGIQTVFAWKDARTRITDHGGRAFTAQLLGTARTWPLSRVGEPGAFRARDVEAIVTLVRCPRTELTPNGLLVAKVTTRFYVEDEPSEGEARDSGEDRAGASSPGPGPSPGRDLDLEEPEILGEEAVDAAAPGPSVAGEGE